jgi:hypothetical protein
LQQAKARAAQDSLVDIQKQILAVEEKQTENIKEQEKARARVADSKKSIGPVSGGTAQAVSIDNREVIATRDLNKLVSAGNDLLKQKNALNERANNLAKFAQTTVEQNPDALLKPGANLPKVDTKKIKDNTKEIEKALEERKAILTEFQKDFEVLKLPVPDLSMPLEKFSIKGLTDELRDKLNDALERTAPIKFKVPVDPVVAIDIKEIPIPLHMNFQVERDLEASKKKAEDIANEQAHSLAKAIEDSFNAALSAIEIEGLSTIGESIGEALTGGDIGSVFQKFGQMLGGAVQALGKQMIALSVAALAAKKALKGIFANPVVGIAAGVALIAVGSALKNLLGGGIKGFYKGGTVKGPGGIDNVPAMLTAGEEVLTTKEAPIWRSLKKIIYGVSSFKMPKMEGGVFHFQTGGTVPSIDTRSPLRRVADRIESNFVVEKVPYVAGFDISHDKVRLMMNRANNYGNTFGR